MKLKHLNSYQRKILICSVVGFLLFWQLESYFVYSLLNKGYSIKINVTSSLPERFWWVDKNKTTNFKVGDYFMFLAPNDKMLTNGESTPLIKSIAGVAGDVVSIKGTGIYINNKVMGHIWPKTGKGHVLHAIEPQTIKAGCYFAWTPALYSYDSRYTDIGLICEKDHRILASAKPLF